MNIKEIQNLIKFVYKSGVEEVKIEKDDFKITIKTKKTLSNKIVVDNFPNKIESPIPVEHEEIVSKEEKITDTTITNQNNTNHIVVKSPIIGTFYRKPAPEKSSFVELGQSISKGDVLCVIEAMKLFNEIESEVEGKIIKILVDDQSPVEFDQPLFIIDPS